MKKFLKILFKILGKLILAAVIFFAATFTLYMVCLLYTSFYRNTGRQIPNR